MNRKLAGWLTFVGVFSALNYAARFSGGESPDDVLYRWSTVVLGIVQFVITLGILLLIARGLPLREAFALRRPRSWGSAVGLATACFVGILAVAAALSPLVDPGEEQGLVPDKWEPNRAAAFAANAVVVIVLAPVVEELMFRGIGFSLLARFGHWAAILGTAVAFALVHGLLEGFPILAAFGAGLAYIRYRTDSVYPTILLHGAFNTFALGGALLV